MITPSGPPTVLAIDDASRIGEARRAATATAGRLGFDETMRGRAAIVASEAATNLSKHGQGGVIVIQGVEAGALGALEIVAIDRGPGMVDLDRCLADGYSTAGSPGTGLGAMARLSDLFDIYSLPGTGTATLARLWSAAPTGRGPAHGPEFGALSLPLAGEDVCGDSWAIEEADGRTLLLVVDGLGHGPEAAAAAREAVRAFAGVAALGLVEIIQAIHAALRSTRGAALAIASMDPDHGELRYAGIGNIAGAIFGAAEGKSTSLVSLNGTVGHSMRKVQEFLYPWPEGSLLVMHSDGLATQWQLGRYPGLAARHPGVAAAVLCRDFKRGRDDVTVVAVREGSGGRR